MGIPRLPLTTHLPYPPFMAAVVEQHEKRPALPEKLKELQTKGRKSLRDMKTDLNMQKNNDSRAEQGSSTARTQECATKTNRLITSELQKRLADYPLYSQDGKHKDALCIAVFFLGNIRWYIMEGQQEGNDFTLYGIVTGLQETEYGYQSVTEMESITYDASEYGLGTLRIEQDKDFKPCTLAEIEDAELQAFLSRLYDKD